MPSDRSAGVLAATRSDPRAATAAPRSVSRPAPCAGEWGTEKAPRSAEQPAARADCTDEAPSDRAWHCNTESLGFGLEKSNKRKETFARTFHGLDVNGRELRDELCHALHDAGKMIVGQIGLSGLATTVHIPQQVLRQIACPSIKF